MRLVLIVNRERERRRLNFTFLVRKEWRDKV